MKKLNLVIILSSTQMIKSSVPNPNIRVKEVSRSYTSSTPTTPNTDIISNARGIVLNPEKADSFDAYEQAIKTVIKSRGLKTSWVNSPKIDDKFLRAFQEIRAAFGKNEINSLTNLKVALESYFEYFQDNNGNEAEIADRIAKLIKSNPGILRTEIVKRLNQNQGTTTPNKPEQASLKQVQENTALTKYLDEQDKQEDEKNIKPDIIRVLNDLKINTDQNVEAVFNSLKELKNNPYIKEYLNLTNKTLIELIAEKIRSGVSKDVINGLLIREVKNSIIFELSDLKPKIQRFNFNNPSEYLDAVKKYITLNTIDGKELVTGTITERTLNRANIIINALEKQGINSIANLKEAMQSFEGLNANPYVQEYIKGNDEKLAELIAQQIKEKGANQVDINRAVQEIIKNNTKESQIKVLNDTKFYETGKRIRAIKTLKKLSSNNPDDLTIKQAIHDNTNVFERFIADHF